MAFRVPNGVVSSNRAIVQSPGEAYPGWHAPRGRVRVSGPSRLAQYQMNWSGEYDFQTWCNLSYPPDLREVIENQNAQATAQILIYRNAPGRYSPRPIPIQDYALQTRQTYIGTVDASGRISNG